MKNELSKKPLYVLGMIFFIGLVFTGTVMTVALVNYDIRIKLLRNPAIQYFKHSYNSLRKIPDIVFLPYQLVPSKLPTYDLSISVNNVLTMNGALASDPISGRMFDNNTVYVKADFDDNQGFIDRIDIRYRGQEANHWNSLQKSYRIRFDAKNYWKGQDFVNFVIPYDRNYYIEPLNMYRAKKFGLIDIPMKFVRLNLNGIDNGVYLEFPQWSQEFLKQRGLPPSKIFSLADGVVDAKSLADYVNTFDETGDTEKKELAYLFYLRDVADLATFKREIVRVLDMDKIYYWNILNILARSNHQTDHTNPLFYLNTNTGKLEMIPWDIGIFDSKISYDDTASPLMKRILSVPEFKKRRDELLGEYINDPKNLEDDLAFYDKLAKETKADFLKDNTKLQISFTYLNLIKKHRQMIVDNFEAAKDFLK